MHTYTQINTGSNYNNLITKTKKKTKRRKRKTNNNNQAIGIHKIQIKKEKKEQA